MKSETSCKYEYLKLLCKSKKIHLVTDMCGMILYYARKNFLGIVLVASCIELEAFK